MSFRESLERICKSVPGALGASVMGYDGIAVDSLEVPGAGTTGVSAGISVDSTLVEYSNIFGQFRNAAQQLQAGDPGELTLRTDRIVAVGRAVSADYFVVVALTPDANVGKARYMLRVGAAQIAAEIG